MGLFVLREDNQPNQTPPPQFSNGQYKQGENGQTSMSVIMNNMVQITAQVQNGEQAINSQNSNPQEITNQINEKANQIVSLINKSSEPTGLERLKVRLEEKIRSFDVKLRAINMKSKSSVGTNIGEKVKWFILQIKKIFVRIINAIVSVLGRLQRTWKNRTLGNKINKLGVRDVKFNTYKKEGNDYIETSRSVGSQANQTLTNNMNNYRNQLRTNRK